MMKLKIKKVNKFYLVENDSEQSASTDSSVGTSNNNDIFAIKKNDSKFLLKFKEYCKSAVNTAEQQPVENKPENASIASGSNPNGESKDPIGDSARGLRNVGGAVQLANEHLA